MTFNLSGSESLGFKTHSRVRTGFFKYRQNKEPIHARAEYKWAFKLDAVLLTLWIHFAVCFFMKKHCLY
jgi:hypothetical protein